MSGTVRMGRWVKQSYFSGWPITWPLAINYDTVTQTYKNSIRLALYFLTIPLLPQGIWPGEGRTHWAIVAIHHDSTCGQTNRILKNLRTSYLDTNLILRTSNDLIKRNCRHFVVSYRNSVSATLSQLDN